MPDIELASYLRFHRKQAGLSQKELGRLIGFLSKDQVSKHERAEALPDLLCAMSYAATFRVHVTDLFPGVYGAVKQGIEERLAETEKMLQQSSVKGRQAEAIARTLEWLWARRDRPSLL